MNYEGWSEKKVRFWSLANELGVMIATIGLISLIPEKVYAGTGRFTVSAFFLAINIGLVLSLVRSRRIMTMRMGLLEQAIRSAEESQAEDERRKSEFIRLNLNAIEMWKVRGEIAMAASHRQILRSLGYETSSEKRPD